MGHILKHEAVECTRHVPTSGMSALVEHFGAEGWAHIPSFGCPHEVMREVQREMTSIDLMMLPGLTPDDWKRSSAPKPKSRTDRIIWVDDKMLPDLPGVAKLVDMLVRFVFMFAKELGRTGHNMNFSGHQRPMLAVYDEGS